MTPDRIEIHKGKGRIFPGYYWTIVAANGETELSSEIYTRHSSAKRAAKKASESYAIPRVVDLTEKAYRRFP